MGRGQVQEIMKKKEIDVKKVQGDYSDNYEKMMGKYWSEIDDYNSHGGRKDKGHGGSPKKRPCPQCDDKDRKT